MKKKEAKKMSSDQSIREIQKLKKDLFNIRFKRINNQHIIWKKPSLITDDVIKDTHDADYVNLVKKSFPSKGFSSCLNLSFPPWPPKYIIFEV